MNIFLKDTPMQKLGTQLKQSTPTEEKPQTLSRQEDQKMGYGVIRKTVAEKTQNLLKTTRLRPKERLLTQLKLF